MHPACPVGHENVMQGPQNDGRGNARRNNRQAITSVLIAQLLTVCDAMGGSSIVTRKQLKLVSPREIGALLSPYIITPYRYRTLVQHPRRITTWPLLSQSCTAAGRYDAPSVVYVFPTGPNHHSIPTHHSLSSLPVRPPSAGLQCVIVRVL